MNMQNRLVGFFGTIFVVVICMFSGLSTTLAARDIDEAETPASSHVQDNYRGSQVGDFYISPNVSFGLAKVSEPSMTGFNLFFLVDIDHLSDGNLDILSSENGFAFRSVEYGLGILSVSRDDTNLSVFIPAQFLYKRSFGMLASKSGILSMLRFGVGPLLATSIELESEKKLTDDEIVANISTKDSTDDWGFGLTVQVGYELSFPINYVSAANLGMQWNFSIIDIPGTLSVKDCKTEGHLIYNAVMLYGGVRFSL